MVRKLRGEELTPLKEDVEVKEALEDVVANLQKTYPRLKGQIYCSGLYVDLQVSDGNLSHVMSFAYPDAKPFAQISIRARIGINRYLVSQTFNFGRDKIYRRRRTPPRRTVLEVAHNFAEQVSCLHINREITPNVDIYGYFSVNREGSIVTGQEAFDSLAQVKEIVTRNIDIYERHGREYLSKTSSKS